MSNNTTIASKEAKALLNKAKTTTLTEAEAAKVVEYTNQQNKDSIRNYGLGVVAGVILGIILR